MKTSNQVPEKWTEFRDGAKKGEFRELINEYNPFKWEFDWNYPHSETTLSYIHRKIINDHGGGLKNAEYERARNRDYDETEVETSLRDYKQLIKNDPNDYNINEDIRWRYFDKFGMALRDLSIDQIVYIEHFIEVLLEEVYTNKLPHKWEDTDSDTQTYLEDKMVWLTDKWSEGKTDLEFQSMISTLYTVLEKAESID